MRGSWARAEALIDEGGPRGRATRAPTRSGGFGGNPEMYNRYARSDAGERLVMIGNAGSTGDGITMMIDAGAALWDTIGTALHCPVVRGATYQGPTHDASLMPYLWLDREGRRFTDEACGFDWGIAGDIVAGLPGACSWTILDTSQIEHVTTDPQILAENPNLTKIPGDLAISTQKEDLAVYTADTLEELAARIGLDPDQLVATVEEYNGYCRAGFDPKFRKGPEFLLPLVKAPYYAFKLEPGILITMGGVRIDDRMRVVDARGRVIPGLYSVGCDAGGLFGDSYSLVVPGTANGFAYTSGWLAADDLAEALEPAATA